ncbi:ML5 [Symbiodinium sp. CCMP2456]|nr:ML5 [Symbiodinium sp. CCMP2456]
MEGAAEASAAREGLQGLSFGLALGQRDEPIEFELNGWSDTETNPDTKEGEKSLPLPCYSHIKDFPSGESTPRTAQATGHDDFDQYVARTPSPRGMDWPSGFGEAGQLPKEEDMRSDPMPGLAPPTHSRVSSSDVALDNKSASKQDLQRLAAEVARLAQENEFLRQRVMAQEQRKDESKSQGESQPAATTPVQQESNMGWATVLMPVSFGPGSGSGSMQDSADSWMGPHGPHSQELGQDSQQARRRRFRQKGDAEFEADLNLQKGRQVRGTAVPTKPVECDLPMEECTTVMLRNLPNNYTRAMLLAMLDSEGFEGKYNFLYLPIDFQSRACLGYAFVNLVDPSYVAQFWAKFSGYSKWVLPSKKVCGVSWSGPHQGLEAHVERYRNSPVMHESVPDEYKPVVLQNGVRVAFPEPSKAPRPPRIRQHHHSHMDGKVAGWQHRRQSGDAPRMPMAVGALPVGSLSRS